MIFVYGLIQDYNRYKIVINCEIKRRISKMKITEEALQNGDYSAEAKIQIYEQ